MAVLQQPQGFGMTMTPLPGIPTGAPPGLEYLASVDRLIIKQKIELMEVLAGCESRNRYNVFNSSMQQMFYAFEESDTCHRICCGPGRGFIFHIQDMNGREVLMLERPFRCCVGCPCCADDDCCKYPINVMDGQGQMIGILRMTKFCCAPRFGIFDSSENQLYKITADYCRCQCPCCCREDIDHPVFSMTDGANVANVAKQWAGAFKELITDADTYCVTFPTDMHIMHKALIFASTFLVDMTLYENQDGGGGA